jgi:tetratricopeptide (TPR) repeat protein
MNNFYTTISRALILSCFFIILYTQSVQAQNTKLEEFQQQQEQMKRAAALRELDSGVYYMDIGQYELAEKKFLHVLNTVKSVPSDLTFFFGKNSYYLDKYKQSIDWLTKYIQLKGTTGQYSEEAVRHKTLAEAEFLKIRSEEASKVAEILTLDYDIDCGPAGLVVCPVCKGDHVTIKRGPFKNEYRTCQYCNEQGLLTCAEYNDLLRGKLAPKR